MTEQGDLYLPYYSIDGRHIGGKIKKQGAKEFRFEGDSNEVALFGVQVANGERHIIITEGEIDAMSAAQMTGYPAVSVPHGAESAVKHCKKCLKFLESFDTIYVVMDGDEVGQRAQEKLMQLFKPGKARSVTLPTGKKDANDMLVSNQGALFKSLLFAGRYHLPTGITTKNDLVNRAVDLYQNRDKLIGCSTGYTGLDNLLGGWRPGEVHVLAAGTGIGKSSLARNFAYRYSNSGKVLYIPLEDMVEVSSLLFAEMRLGCSLIHQNSVDSSTLQNTLDDVLENILVYDQRGSVGVDELCDAISYVVREHDVQFVVLDHITAMADGLDLDERKALDACMKRLKFDIASALSVTVVVVSHLSRDTSDKEDNIPSLSRLKGASSIAQYADTVFGVSRKRDSTLMTIRTLKGNRVWGQWGEFTLEWDETTRQLVECTTQLDGDDDEQSSEAPLEVRGQSSAQPPGVGVREHSIGLHHTSDSTLLPTGLESTTDGVVHRNQGTIHSSGQEETNTSTVSKSRQRRRVTLPA
jgi:twinkle protein